MQTTDLELGYLAHPETGTHPGVVMIPDVRGLYDHFRDLARRLASEGFAVLAVDLYRRTGPPEIPDPAAAMRWIRELSDPQVLADVQAGVDRLAAHPAVGGKPIGVTGFCMGGQYALLAACGGRGLSACVPFYGMLAYAEGLDPAKKPRSPLDAASDLVCPVLGLYGEEDALIPVDQVREFETRALATGQPCEMRIYAGAGHAFLNETRPEAYRAEAARDAWARMVAFFRETLGASHT
ncbi:MAG: dienelactone hydrolase family protein [Deltaproteobacteria bacterium]|nr:MAG: dienelactone hydrolase family protein [Deltaproteobacteria bacterium]